MKPILAFALLLCSFASFGQIGTTFDGAKKQGISLEKLDKEHPGGIWLLPKSKSVSPALAPEEAYGNAYYKMLQDLGTFLKKNDFKWEKPTHGFNRIYFNPDGSIAYFLYNFKADQISAEKEKQYNALLNTFIKDYRFTYPMKSKFAQCSKVTFQD
jgi:hypothetical protein